MVAAGREIEAEESGVRDTRGSSHDRDMGMGLFAMMTKLLMARWACAGRLRSSPESSSRTSTRRRALIMVKSGGVGVKMERGATGEKALVTCTWGQTTIIKTHPADTIDFNDVAVNQSHPKMDPTPKISGWHGKNDGPVFPSVFI
jgi:hypothetical protein